jgi:hypothetical protein
VLSTENNAMSSSSQSSSSSNAATTGDEAILREKQAFANSYPINLDWDSLRVESTHGGPTRTSTELIQHLLLDSGMQFEVPTPMADIVMAGVLFNSYATKRPCVRSATIHIGDVLEKQDDANETGAPLRQLRVVLDESKWYSAKFNVGVRQQGSLFTNENNNGLLQGSVESSASAALYNLSGCLDQTQVSYSVAGLDQSLPSYTLKHIRPLYTVLGPFSNLLLQSLGGSLPTLEATAVVQVADLTKTRSYFEHSKSLGAKADLGWWALDWNYAERDIVPARHANPPFSLQASHEICQQAGPTTKHSVRASCQLNVTDNDATPRQGVQFHSSVEVAGPPGTVGFVKFASGAAVHVPVTDTLSAHAALNAGYMRALSFGGRSAPPTISDRFFVGGPMQLRGFQASGIGPRSKQQGAADALGGDFYYTATGMLSSNVASGVQFFGFGNAGTCLGSFHNVPFRAIVQSTRVSVGAGVALSLFGPRIEFTVSQPLRAGPRDIQQPFQFGIGVNFG